MSSHETMLKNQNKILQETTKLLRESNLNEQTPLVTLSSISTNATDTKEAMAMVFYDCIRTNKNFVKLYTRLQKEPTDPDIKELKQTLAGSKSLGSDYGTSVNLDNLHKFIVQVLKSKNRNKLDKDYKVLNNGFSAANVISSDSRIKTYIGNKNYATRGDSFTKIRTKAVSLFKDIKVDLSFPDNWCPGDFYLMKSQIDPSAIPNVIELNSNFAGPSYPKGGIVAISLKMQDAQAGKGTTFLTTVLSVPELDKKKTIPTNQASKDGLKYLSAKRVIYKYAINNAAIAEDKIRAKLGITFKLVNDLIKNKTNIPTIAKYFEISPEKLEKQNSFIIKNYKKMGKEATNVFPTIDKKVLSSKQTDAYSDGFREAYVSFTKYIEQMGIQIKSTGVDDFINKIKQGRGSKKESGVQNILIKKAECYTRAIELIKKWSDKNKEIAKPFKKLGTIDNPLLAITMFAIAQHGANPDFFKVHGSDTGLLGTLEVFPAKSKVDKTTIIQSLTIKDSENAAGFDASYNMKLNNVKYKTTLSFRFSDSSFRVEVQELEESMG